MVELVTVAAVGLLAVGVTGAVVRPFRLPGWVIPLICAVAVVAFGLITVSDAGRALDPLFEPILFLLAAVPFAVMLDQLGFFSALAGRLVVTGHGSGALWILAAMTTTLLNLDASVVLLTPLYVSIARRSGRDPLALAFQPVLLACLASSALPVSNLTNLIAAEQTSATTIDFVSNLSVPSLVASTVGWFAYRRVLQPERRCLSPVDAPTASGGTESLTIGAVVLSVVLFGFVTGPAIGVAPWVVAVVADGVLVSVLRRSPWRQIPVGTSVIVASLGVLAAAAVADVAVGNVIGGDSMGALAATVAVSAASANLVNNLPAFLVALPAIGDEPTPTLWATLIGVNMGPVVLVTGSLASLLWLDALGRLGVSVHPRDFTRVGVRVGLPAAAAGAVSFLVLNAVR